MNRKVVDTNVVLRTSGNPFRMLAPPEVREEVISEEGRRKIENLDIEFRNPTDETLEKVESKSSEICSPTSRTDEKVVGVALETGVELISDDLAVQNLAAHLGLEFSGFMEDRIEELREWSIRCETCRTQLQSMEGSCNQCGGEPERYTSNREPLG
jgi:UPF0271 protein